MFHYTNNQFFSGLMTAQVVDPLPLHIYFHAFPPQNALRNLATVSYLNLESRADKQGFKKH
jgi:hypothetical protein